MATFTLNKNSTTGVAPSKTGRLADYVEVQRVDFSKLNGTTGVSVNDVVFVMNIPKYCFVRMVLAEIITPLTRTTGTSTPSIKATLSLGGTNWLSAQSLTAAAGPIKMDTGIKASLWKKFFYSSNLATNQVGLTITTLSAKSAFGVVNVYAYITPLAGINS